MTLSLWVWWHLFSCSWVSWGEDAVCELFERSGNVDEVLHHPVHERSLDAVRHRANIVGEAPGKCDRLWVVRLSSPHRLKQPGLLPLHAAAEAEDLVTKTRWQTLRNLLRLLENESKSLRTNSSIVKTRLLQPPSCLL